MGAVTFATCPVAVRGEWHAPPEAALAVITRVRDVSLAGIALRSEHQPDQLWVENKPSGVPSIWLHREPAKTAWINVVVAPRAWSQLAYQVCHEFGHGIANSWEKDATERPPSRWLEETLAESFALRGLGLLADSWAAHPPFPGDNAYGAAIRTYRQDILTRYRACAQKQGATDLLRWYEVDQRQLNEDDGLGLLEQSAVPVVLGLIEPEPVLIEDYNGLNRWPERTALPLPAYLRKWRDSCKQIGAPARLPVVLADLLGVS